VGAVEMIYWWWWWWWWWTTMMVVPFGPRDDLLYSSFWGSRLFLPPRCVFWKRSFFSKCVKCSSDIWCYLRVIFFSIIFIMFVVFDVACLLRVVYTIQRKQIACVFFVHIQLNTCSEWYCWKLVFRRDVLVTVAGKLRTRAAEILVQSSYILS